MKRIASAVAALLLCTGSPVAAEDWKYDALLYGWLCGLDGTMGIAGVNEQPIEATFEDLAGYVDFAIAGHFEMKKSRGLILTDVSYIGLNAERDATVANQPVTIDTDLTQWILEAGGGYRITPALDVLVVGRYYSLDLGGTSSSIAGSSSAGNTKDWADVYLGARFTKTLEEKWVFSIRGDIGTGGSEFAWFGDVAVGYRFSDLITGMVSWRVLSLDREGDVADADYFLYDITQNGLGVGLGFSF